MSQGQGFDMALLEGKDRSELAAIAEQLGEKPSARAKKADIVALIMRLVGAEHGDGSTPDDAGAPTGAGDGAEEAGAVGDGAATAGADASTVEDEAGAAAAAADGAPAAEADGDEGAAGEGEAEAASGGEAEGGTGGNGQQGDGDDVEPGNRRRRRRGRDRDRRGDGEEQVHAEPVEVEGMVDLRDEGYGFLRLHGYLPSRDDAYISVRQTRQFGLRTGDIVTGRSRPAARNERNPALLQIDTVNGFPAHSQPARPHFDDLTPCYPDERLTLESADDPGDVTARIIDLVAPIGKGSRGLIVAPPKSGKTTVLEHIARAVERNHPDVELLVVLVDERPEDVTDVQRGLERGSVAASTFDRPAEEHTAIAELVVERAKRMVENGRDVVVLLDGLTRLARAANVAAPASGRTLVGGIEPGALHAPKRLFGAARKAEEGGSLTIVATIQVETSSAADQVIFEEFEGTETMELKLDRRLADRRVVPSIDLGASSTRHDEALFGADDAAKVAALRQQVAELDDRAGTNSAGLDVLLERMAAAPTNAQLLAGIDRH